MDAKIRRNDKKEYEITIQNQSSFDFNKLQEAIRFRLELPFTTTNVLIMCFIHSINLIVYAIK